MKFFFSFICALITLSSVAQYTVVFSGKFRPWETKVIHQFLIENKLYDSPLIHWERDNDKCIKRKSLIQFCATSTGIKIFHTGAKRIRKTLGRYLDYAKTTKALKNEGHI